LSCCRQCVRTFLSSTTSIGPNAFGRVAPDSTGSMRVLARLLN
jgi:hypothetical protein